MIISGKCICHTTYVSVVAYQELCMKDEVINYTCYKIMDRVRYEIKFDIDNTRISMGYDDFIKNFQVIEDYRENKINKILNMKTEYSFEEFVEIDDPILHDEVASEYANYSDGEQTFEQWYYANVKWVSKLINSLRS